MKSFNQFISEAYSKAERQSRIKPKPVTFQTITRSAKDGKHFPYREVLPKKGIYHNTPVVQTPEKKKEGDIWKGEKFVYPGIPLRYLFKGGTTL